VSDTGLGMTEAVKERIFEPFFTTKEVGQGTGLGLSTCLGIIKQSHGLILVESKPGHGAIFKIYLPRAQDKLPGSTATQPEPDDLPRGNETILLVEDETVIRTLAARILSRQGYTVIAAANGEEALQLLEAHPSTTIALLLTHVVMPQTGGNILANWLRARYPALKVLLMSGSTDTLLTSQGIPFLQKPFKMSSLIYKVREILDA
jgi:CheY-like chemotaxis protein